jgi:SAM-dependent methyltransferase
MSVARLGSRDPKAHVRTYWDDKPCGSTHGSGQEGTLEWYAEIERRRAELEPFIDRFADFGGARGRKVLEVGVGLGTDFVRFARAGANVIGLDLSERSLAHARRRLELEGLHGELVRADAEALPFPNDTFDRVYSWGVLHHTPDTRRAIQEALRVLRPGGELTLMLYGRHSWVAYGLWLRYALLRGRPWRSLSDVIAHHMESEGTKAFTFRELRDLCEDARDMRIRRVATPYDRRVGGPLVRLTGDRLGWFVVVRARPR